MVIFCCLASLTKKPQYLHDTLINMRKGWVLSQIDMKPVAVCTIIIARFLYISAWKTPWTSSLHPTILTRDLNLLGRIVGIVLLHRFQLEPRKKVVKCTQNYTNNTSYSQLPYTSFVYLQDFCHFSLPSTFPSCWLFHCAISHHASSIHQGTWCTHLHKPIVPRRVDLAKLWLLGYVPGRKQVPEMQQLKVSVSGMERFVCSHSWIVQLDSMSDFRTTWTWIW